MRYALNFTVLVITAFGFLSVAAFDVRWVVAAVFAATFVAALFDSIWGD